MTNATVLWLALGLLYPQNRSTPVCVLNLFVSNYSHFVSELCKVSEKALKTLATEEDVNDLISFYHEVFSNRRREDDEPLTDQQPPSNSATILDRAPGEGDPGMEVEAKMTPAALSEALGFVDGMPVLFNRWIADAFTAWDDVDNHHLFVSPGIESPHPSLSKFELNWSQTSGMHSFARTIWSSESRATLLGFFLADQTGLGKTLLAIGIAAFMMDVGIRQQLGKPLPPVLGMCLLSSYNIVL